MFQSQIRVSDINALFEKVGNQNYGKYLHKMHIGKARAFDMQTISLDFPVTALIGPNGGGKTTFLGAAGCVYRSVRPALFFAKCGRFDESMQNWSIEYEVIDKEVRPNDVVRRKAKFKNFKWKRNALDRQVLIFRVSRTVPANERKNLRRCVSGEFDVPHENIFALNQEVSTAVARVLDKDVSQFQFINVDGRGLVTLLAGRTARGIAYSEFHFGAGESSIIRMAIELEKMEENALILIEEIENGLHPVATIRMVEYLIDLALRKKCQALFTTHSNDALVPLPDKAIWACVGEKVFQGKLDIHSLRAITGRIDSRLVFFVEDSFSKAWIEEILRSDASISMDAIGVHALEGDGTAVNIHLSHNEDPSAEQKSVCFIDGDSRQQEDSERLIFRFPGQSPESYIYDTVLDKLDDLAGELAVALLRPYEEQSRIKEIVRSVRQTNRDPHLLYSQIGKQLGLLAETRVREAFLSVWARSYPEVVNDIIQAITGLLPRESDPILMC